MCKHSEEEEAEEEEETQRRKNTYRAHDGHAQSEREE
jgi:hypothetical protein